MRQPTCIPSLENPNVNTSNLLDGLTINMPSGLDPQITKYLQDMNSQYQTILTKFGDAFSNILQAMGQNNQIIGDRLSSLYEFLYNPENVELGNISIDTINGSTPPTALTINFNVRSILALGGIGTWNTIDLSGTIGAKTSYVFLQLHVVNVADNVIYVRKPGSTKTHEVFSLVVNVGGTNYQISHNPGFTIVETDSGGKIELYTAKANNSAVLVGYIN